MGQYGDHFKREGGNALNNWGGKTKNRCEPKDSYGEPRVNKFLEKSGIRGKKGGRMEQGKKSRGEQRKSYNYCRERWGDQSTGLKKLQNRIQRRRKKGKGRAERLSRGKSNLADEEGGSGSLRFNRGERGKKGRFGEERKGTSNLPKAIWVGGG